MMNFMRAEYLMHNRLMQRLAGLRVPAKFIHHEPEGNTLLASHVRGHSPNEAAKSIVLRISQGGKKKQYVLAVVCGHHRVNLNAVARCFGGIDAHFVDRSTAYDLTGCISGSVIPFSFNEELLLVADYQVLEQPVLYFNTGRLDHSVALSTKHWLSLASPRIEHIAEQEGNQGPEQMKLHDRHGAKL